MEAEKGPVDQPHEKFMPGRIMLRNRWIHSVLLLGISLAFSCGCSRSDKTPGHERVGVMRDRSYFKTRDMPPRISASGKQIAMAQFEGRFLWGPTMRLLGALRAALSPGSLQTSTTPRTTASCFSP